MNVLENPSTSTKACANNAKPIKQTFANQEPNTETL